VDAPTRLVMMDLMRQVTILPLGELSVNDLMLHSRLEWCVRFWHGHGVRISDRHVRSYKACVRSSLKWRLSGY
jgi:hypothetical protein